MIKNLYQNFIKRLLGSYNKRNALIKKNIITTFFIKSLSIVISLALVPLTIKYLNADNYGVWITITSFFTLLSFLDIGFGNGLRNTLTNCFALGKFKRARIYISTTYAIFIFLFSTFWIFFFIASRYLNWQKILNTTSVNQNVITKLVVIVFAFFCLQMILKIINTVLLADQKPAKISLFDLVGQVISLISIIFLLKKANGSLINVCLIFSGTPVLILIFSSFWFYGSKYRNISPKLKYVRLSFSLDILKLGLKFFIIQIAVLFIYQANNLIIAQISGPLGVTTYNIAYKYFSVVYMAFVIIITPFWSAYTDAYTLNDFEWMRHTLKKLLRISLLFVVILLIFLSLSNFIYLKWVGNKIQIDFFLSLTVAIYFATNIFHALFVQLLNGIGKIRLQLYVCVLGLLVSLPLSYYLGKKIGISGVIISNILFNLIIIAYAPRQVILIINNKAKGIWNK